MNHGTLTCYVNHRCRCEACRTAHRDYLADYNRRRPRNDGLGPKVPLTDQWTTTEAQPREEDPRWMADALCRGMDPDLFFPERGDLNATREAKKVCATCPHQAPCLEYALVHHEEHGVWGGTSPRDRRRLRKEAA